MQIACSSLEGIISFCMEQSFYDRLTFGKICVIFLTKPHEIANDCIQTLRCAANFSMKTRCGRIIQTLV
jgi:hypothetical protein